MMNIKANVIIDPNTGCWNWTASLFDSGYGQLKFRGRTSSAHRVAYTLAYGEIDDGMQIDHLCFNRQCCNPKHLEMVTPGENVRRAQPILVHCKRGHEYSGDNLKKQKTGGGRIGRLCRECQRELAKERYAANPKKHLDYAKANKHKYAEREKRYFAEYNATRRRKPTKEENAERWARQKDRINAMKRERYALLRAQGKSSHEASRSGRDTQH